MEKVLEITETGLRTLENPPRLQISVSGTVPTGDWSNPRLTPHVTIQAPPDGIYDFDFVADRPGGTAPQMISLIHAGHVWKAFPDTLKGVRIHALQNSEIALLESARPDRQPNRFTLRGCDDNTHIVFFPKIFIPLGTSGSPADSQFEYDGAEGHLIFRGKDVSQEETSLGSIISVMLRPDADAGGLDFALILPPVSLGNEMHQEFETIGIKIQSRGHMISPAGAGLAYKAVTLKGIAEDIPIL
jgi:hypothetical protein